MFEKSLKLNNLHQYILSMIKATILTLLLSFLLFFSLESVNAQDLLYTPHPNFNHVAVNNEVISKEDEGFVKVKYLDAVKIVGTGTPGNTVEVYIDQQSYESTVDEYGYWFVLFSVMDLDAGSYPVEAVLNDLNNKEHLITLVVVEDETLGNGDSQEQLPDKEIENSSPSFLVFAISVLLSFALGWIVSFLFNKDFKKKN